MADRRTPNTEDRLDWMRDSYAPDALGAEAAAQFDQGIHRRLRARRVHRRVGGALVAMSFVGWWMLGGADMSQDMEPVPRATELAVTQEVAVASSADTLLVATWDDPIDEADISWMPAEYQALASLVVTY